VITGATVNTFTTLKKISISNECCCFELSIYQRTQIFIFITVSTNTW